MAYSFDAFDEKAGKAKERLKEAYKSLHTGRATPAVLDGVRVEVYGARQPIAHIASVSIEDPRTLFIAPWEKDSIKDIEKAILASDLGLSVSATDTGVRVSFPELTVERKEALARVVRERLEEARVAVRKAREEAWSDIQEKERAKEISEDEKFSLKEKLQERVDKEMKELEEAAAKKEADIMQ